MSRIVKAAPTPTPAAIPAAERYSEEEREIISLLDAQIGNKLITKAKQAGSDSDNETLQAIINENSQSVKSTLSNKYTPEVLRTAINKKLGRLQDTGNPSAHTEVSKRLYINFLKEFLKELNPQRPPREAIRSISLPNFIKPN
jgi:hypothetical protein